MNDQNGRLQPAEDDAAESTHHRPPGMQPDPDVLHEIARTSESYHGSLKSIRLHPPRPMRAGLALKLALPILAALLAGLVVAGLAARAHIHAMLMEEVKSDAANSAFSMGMIGRFYINHRNRFLQDNPDYLTRPEWRTGDHWLVRHGFVSQREWAEITGFELNEYAPAGVLARSEKSVILANFTRWINSPEAMTEIVSVSISSMDGNIIASSESTSFRFSSSTLRGVPLPLSYIQAGGSRILVDYLEDAGPEPLVRGVARIMRSADSDEQIGTAEVILRTSRQALAQHNFTMMGLGISGLLLLFMAFICWYSAQRVTTPLRALAADLQAMAEGDYSRRSVPAGSDELGQLAMAFNSLAERLRVARANEKENSRIESDLAIAREIQNNLLPPQTPRVRGLDIYTAYRPAREIGGDYYDFLPVDSQHMGIAAADASGKSIPAALVMTTMRAILRFVAPGNPSAAETLTRVNAILSVDIPKGMFVTAYYLILDPLDNTMLCASAGHTPLLIARQDGSVELVNPDGIALGFDGGPIFQRSIREQRVSLERGDRVLLYTDGVVECVNPANEEYSNRRLREFLRRNRELSSHDFVGALMADLDRHRGAADMRDDTTIVTFRVM